MRWCAESNVRWSRRAVQQSAQPGSSVETWQITPTATKKERSANPASGCAAATAVRCAVTDRLNPPASARQTRTHPATDRGLVPARLAVGAPLHSWTDPPTSRSQADLNSTSRALLQRPNIGVWAHPKSLKAECERAQGGVCARREQIRAHQRDEEAGSENKKEGECSGRIFSFSYSDLTEMMSALNEFPERVLLPCREEKTKQSFLSSLAFLLDQRSHRWHEGTLATNTNLTGHVDFQTHWEKNAHCRHTSIMTYKYPALLPPPDISTFNDLDYCRASSYIRHETTDTYVAQIHYTPVKSCVVVVQSVGN